MITKSGEKLYWITLHQLEGHFAMWAVRQSPYHCPDDLATVVRKHRELFKEEFFDGNEMAQVAKAGLDQMIERGFLSMPEVRKWNERRNGNKSPFGFVSRFNKPSPDNDFIDLDALRMNTVRSLWQEVELEQ